VIGVGGSLTIERGGSLIIGGDGTIDGMRGARRGAR
jgi:hypothetical protein